MAKDAFDLTPNAAEPRPNDEQKQRSPARMRLERPPNLEENAVKTLSRFVAHKIRRCEFVVFGEEQQSETLVDHAKRLAQEAGAEYRYLQGAHRPLMRQPWFRSLSYYWVVDQAEFSTDLIFTSREALAGPYPRLLDHAVVNFSAKDILTFLGRRYYPRFDGEVLTHCQKGRWARGQDQTSNEEQLTHCQKGCWPGARIKHRMKNNWLKMYDKFALVLRIETVINDPREFGVRRLRTREGRREMV